MRLAGGGSGWLSALSSDGAAGGLKAENTSAKTAGIGWLASLSKGDDTEVDQVAYSDPACGRKRLRLSADEYESSEAEEDGDEDGDGWDAAAAATATATDCIEVEGFLCRRRGSELVLRLPRAGVDGPTVGRWRAGGAIAFDGVDEWAQELYGAAPPRSFSPDLGHAGDDSAASRANARRSLGSAFGFDLAGARAALEQAAVWRWLNFASADEVRGAHAELESLYASGRLSAAAAGTTATAKARSDRVAFFGVWGGVPRCPPCCLALFRRLEAAGAALAAQGWPPGARLLCPRLGMGAIYDGAGARYAAHRDNERLPTGRWVNHRVLTAVAYVNLPGAFADPAVGGQLRCHAGAKGEDIAPEEGATAAHAEDITPEGGTAVLFDAREVLHEVLPSYARRYALTLWFVGAAEGGLPGPATRLRGG